ncbi:MAG: hypothetical protein JW781_01355 [Deltaproteobacteria bacterium]|nr:hypothetical protein [Candidatus Anaeroferrophillacea bacterium]
MKRQQFLAPVISCTLVLLLLAGCTCRPGTRPRQTASMKELNCAIKLLVKDVERHFLDRDMFKTCESKENHRFLYASFMDEEDYHRTTPFGRLLADAMATELQQKGFQIVEARLARAVHVDPQYGVVALSQDLDKLMDLHEASFVITGVYTRTSTGVYISAKVIGRTSQVVYGSAKHWIPRNILVNSLLDYHQPTVRVERLH